MAKRKTAGNSSTPSKSRKLTAGEVQRRIDKLDRDLLKQVNERARLVQKLARLQRDAGQAVVDFDSDQQRIAAAAEANKGPIDNRCVESVMREVISGCRALIAPLRVAYLGPPYSYSHLAAKTYFGSSAELVSVGTIAAAFEEVNRRQAEFGVVPVENSTDGRVVDTLDMFARLPVKVCGEVQLRIHHNLLAKCSREEVREVYSKPQALSQCRDWLAKHLPAARTIEMTSTAAAAHLAADKPGAAAVASREAGAQYGLTTLAENIEDNKHNVTRFSVIGNESSKRTGNDKTSLMFEVPHQPGALADAMTIFKRNRLNLTWIESFPISGSRSEYLFFVELEGHEADLKVRRALTSLDKKTVRLEVLGSYASRGVGEE